jgi:hypothetical protein
MRVHISKVLPFEDQDLLFDSTFKHLAVQKKV